MALATKTRVWLTVAGILLFIAVILVSFVNRIQQPRVMTLTEMQINGLYIFDTPRDPGAFTLLDHRGAPFTKESLKGDWTLLFFGFTHCPDICPTTLYDLSKVKAALIERGLSEKDVQFVFISVDPARDKAAKLQRYVEYFDPSFLATTGSVGQLTNLTRQLGSPFRAEPETAENVYEVTHSSAIYLVDPKGQYAGIISPPFVTADVADQFVLLYQTTQPPTLALGR